MQGLYMKLLGELAVCVCVRLSSCPHLTTHNNLANYCNYINKEYNMTDLKSSVPHIYLLTYLLTYLLLTYLLTYYLLLLTYLLLTYLLLTYLLLTYLLTYSTVQSPS